MEYQEKENLLDSQPNQPSKNKNCVEVNDDVHRIN